MKLVEYMPPFLKNVVEFNKIFDAEDVEIESMRYLIDSILREVIVKSALVIWLHVPVLFLLLS